VEDFLWSLQIDMTSSSQKGFTLIETLIYLGLYAIIMTGALTAIYTIFESSARNQVKAMVQEEGTFILGKIDWALTGAKTIGSPPTGSTGSTLSITKFDSTAGNPIVISLSGANAMISRSGNPGAVLNNSNVSVTNLTFTHTSASGSGSNPESVAASFTLQATTSDGLSYSQSFATVKYLRK